MKKSISKVLAPLAGLALSFTVSGEDIELYVNHNVEITEKPRVLMIFDTSGSMAWDVTDGGQCYRRNAVGDFYTSDCFESRTFYHYTQQCYRSVNGYAVANCNDSRLGVAKKAISQLIVDNDNIDFGLMRFRGGSGGYVLSKIGSNKQTLVAEIDKLPASGSTPLTETLWEAYRYITGKSVDFGRNELERDFTAEINGTYISPFKPVIGEPARCDNSVNVILMTDGDPTSDNDRNNSIRSEHNFYFDDDLPFESGTYSNSYLVALAKVLHGTKDVKVDLYPNTDKVLDSGRVYTIGFGTGMSQGGIDLLDKAATVGGGQYLEAKTAEDLSKALKRTISNIREVNDSFSSPSVASNNVDQTRSRDAIYLGMFYPQTGTRWRGNLKKLKVSGDKIVDSKGAVALDSNGLIKDEAKTFWLPENSPADGNLVAEGGVNLRLSTMDIDSRNLYTEVLGSLIEFKSSNLLNLPTLPLGLLSTDIDWARGVDVDDEDGDKSRTDQRNDIFGDPLHSKPVAIDYGNNDTRLLIGTNAGFLHMFKDAGNTISESWAFIPSALFNIIKPLRDNQADTKLYGMDGPISVYYSNKGFNNEGVDDGVINASKGDEVWAFAGMRRGGKNYYALNISDPDNPKKLWSKVIEGGKGEFKELAQTWSKPQIAYIKAFGDEPLLVFGAGYDTNKDNATRSEDERGRGIYIIKAKTGEKVWGLTPEENNFKGKHSIAADVSLLDSDYDGYIDRIYAADTGGNLWRVDMPGTDKSKFTHFKLAELGSNKATQDRRFFYKPLIARTLFSKVSKKTVNGETSISRLDTPYDAVVIGSGNRSKPTQTNERDQLYMIRDENVVTKSFVSNIPAAIQPADLMLMNSDPFGNALDDIDDFVSLEADLAKDFKGWRYDMAVGEKSLAEATVVGGVAYFTSFKPASEGSTQNQCSLSGGSGSLYAFHLHYGTKVYEQLKFTTSYDVPDTPKLFFGEGPSCVDAGGDGKCDDDPTNEVKKESQFYLIGPGIKGENAENPLKPVEIKGPDLHVVNGKIELYNKQQPIGFGFKTQQTYIYKREENDEIDN